MRYVVYGAGAIGGVIGAELFLAGHDVVLIARGAHHDAIERQGLTYVTEARRVELPIPVVDHPARLLLGRDDVVVLAMKSQHTADAIEALAESGADAPALVCAQNGVANERSAARYFERVYALCAQGWGTHLSPGVVAGNSEPVRGLYQLGRYPLGVDDVTGRVVEDLRGAQFLATEHEDVMSYKYAKLLGNLRNAAQALFAPGEVDVVAAPVRAEGTTVLDAAGIAYLPPARFRAMLAPEVIHRATIEGFPTTITSTWQSLARGTGNTETDYLNGEVALLGRLHGVPTPANVALQLLTRRAAAERLAPASLAATDFFDQLARRT